MAVLGLPGAPTFHGKQTKTQAGEREGNISVVCRNVGPFKITLGLCRGFCDPRASLLLVAMTIMKTGAKDKG